MSPAEDSSAPPCGNRASTPRKAKRPESRSDGESQLSPSAGGSDSGPGFLGNGPARRRERRKYRSPPKKRDPARRATNERDTEALSAGSRLTTRPTQPGKMTSFPAVRAHPAATRLDSPSPGTAPRPLQARARPAQPSEPILLPKVRIQVADFPYPHSSSH